MKALLAIALALLAGSAPARHERFELLGHLTLPAYSGDVAVEGGYAYVSSHRGAASCPARGVRVVDVRDPRKPKLVGSFARVASTWTEKTIVRRVATAGFHGELAAVSFQACAPGAFQGFGLYDVTRPRHPRELARVPLVPRGTHELWLATARGRAWVYTAILRSEQLTGEPGFRIFDVTRPSTPRRVGAWGLGEIGVTPRADPSGSASGDFVHSAITNAAATRAYLSYWDFGTVVLDIRDPTRPRYLGRTQPVQGHAHSAWLAGSLLAETHEIDGGRPALYDVADPRQPRPLSRLALPPLAPAGSLGRVSGIDLTRSVHDPKLVGGEGIFSWYAQGVVAFDLRDPHRPRFLDRFLPPPTRDPEQLLCPGARCTAVWGVAPAGDGVVLASDLVSGLWVLRLR